MTRSTGVLTISIDLELGWGNWDNLSSYHIEHILSKERLITTRLLEIFDRYQIPVTWAFVAALLDSKSSTDMPGDESLWYAPDIIDKICAARVTHDLGSHGGWHRYFDDMTEQQAIEDLQFVSYIHKINNLSLRSFVYPRNKVARTELLGRENIAVFRGQDKAWHENIRDRHMVLGRVANLVDKMVPIAPQAVEPESVGGLLNLPGSMLFISRNGVRRLVHPSVMLKKLEKGLVAAVRSKNAFHLWFHPSNFWGDTNKQFQIFENFIAKAAEQVAAGNLDVRPMAGFA